MLLAMAAVLGLAYSVTPYTAGGAEGKPLLVAGMAWFGLRDRLGF